MSLQNAVRKNEKEHASCWRKEEQKLQRRKKKRHHLVQVMHQVRQPEILLRNLQRNTRDFERSVFRGEEMTLMNQY